jgi:16S rRNA (adenine1518-N6/adenine1519-N6)-dimethyltransferase
LSLQACDRRWWRLKGLPGALEALDQLGIDPQRRAETLSVGEFTTIAQTI